MATDFDRFLQELTASSFYRGQLVHLEEIPARRARYGRLSFPLKPETLAALANQGIKRLYSHQVEALEALHRGENVTVVTGTASGKTLCFNVPILEALLEDFTTRALYLYPTKALAQDQLKGLERLLAAVPSLSVHAGTYDGDTPPDARKLLRDRGALVLTNPDMLHQGILPNHARWARFFGRLKFVVVDEIHTYRGIFGSNVADVLRRLNRICERYGAHPQYVCCSATIANPKELAERLTGRKMTLVDQDGSPRGARKFLFWNPPFTDETQSIRRSPHTEAQVLMTELVKAGVPTIAFTQTRSTTERLYRYVRESLAKASPRLAERVCAYRGGYLPNERRQLEQRLFKGEMLGVVSTNALELGLDIGALEACLLVGYPGSISSTLQRAGRAGRGRKEALVVLIARNSPLDQYLIHHPEYFFQRSPESAVLDWQNPYLLHGHLACAAKELPLETAELEATFGPLAEALLELLAQAGQVRKLQGKWYYAQPGFPAGEVSLRSTGEGNYTILDTTDGRNEVIGELDEMSAFLQLHKEAVYLHGGETYFVHELDLEKRQAKVERTETDYFTTAMTDSSIVVNETEKQRALNEATVFFGDVDVATTVYMFRKVKFGSRDSLGFGNLDLPTRTLNTLACWLMPPKSALERVASFGRVGGDGLLGVANVLGSVLPMFLMCDSSDLGTAVDASNTPLPSIYLYDRAEGGVGYAEKAYDVLEEALEAALQVIKDCPCKLGCPSCVGAPLPPWGVRADTLSTRGFIPDKEAARVILHDLLQLEPYVPPPLTPEDESLRLGTAQGGAPADSPSTLSLPPNLERRLWQRLQRRNTPGRG